MGQVKRILNKTALPDREAHNSRMFVDLCENIHIHYRELRMVFSLDEYFEFADILQKSTEDVRSYLAQNPGYEEGKYDTLVMVAGGRERQRKLLQNSPAPNQSTYFANDFAIELQDESVTDEIHVHWRDYRFALNREQFRVIAAAFERAKHELDRFEAENKYLRRPHLDRTMEDFVSERQKYSGHVTRIGGEQLIPVKEIRTVFDSGKKSFSPDPEFIDELARKYSAGEYVFPIVVSTEQNGEHVVVDGNHRLQAAKLSRCAEINCLVMDLPFEQTADFRRAEWLLKLFDRKTGHVYGTSDFNRAYFAHRASRHYVNHFNSLLAKRHHGQSGKRADKGPRDRSIGGRLKSLGRAAAKLFLLGRR
jgi:hypothetical protein